MSEKRSNFIKTLGPGIMFAGTCIGGSHLVQSTRAGADYGFELLIVILLVNLFKYPFFEFASRYTNATGLSTIDGFKKLGNWTLWVYGGITVVSMFIVTAAIFSVTSGLLVNLVGAPADSILYWLIGLSVIVWSLLLSGKFNLLDSALKVIGVLLVLSVLTATIMVLFKGRTEVIEGFVPMNLYTTTGFAFTIALMGWMPTGVDMSAWASLWTQERIKQTGYHPTLKETLLDFNIGYFITVFFAVCFLILGAYVMYGSGEVLSNNGVVFSSQLVTMFVKNIGEWSYIVIAAAAFFTMFGTALTLVDGYARSMEKVVGLLKEADAPFNRSRYIYWLSLTVLFGFMIVYLGTIVIAEDGTTFVNFKTLIDFATGLSFVVGPIAAYLNYKIIFNKDFPKVSSPAKWLKILAISGIAFLTIFALVFIASFFLKF
jgi:Mn2+/Fe2+ NRAMP family transporter